MTMRLFFSLMTLLTLMACQEDDGRTYAIIETDFGDMRLMLYNETPQHRDNFIKLAEEGFYDSLLFHRVIEGFMIQGGDPDSRRAGPLTMLGAGGPGYQIPQEIGFPHLRGALGAARDNNPEKNSSGSQFYIVQGAPIDAVQLNQIEARGGFKYNEAQRRLYLEEGGAPFLDGNYTVFGELVDGFEVLDEIATQQTGKFDRPLEDIRMKIRIQ